ncbi:TIGR03084 family protein [Rhodococcus sp. 15-725-2-2b]|uniref:TIGR03084 family metal-binding protein n=1 Tax=unclassified Rhodococcus (in: high G+C Gram-positive bacteria) TaxID=192944 RepID=UPI000B9A8EEB|nr:MULTISPECIES: TIGR03084 family metal-binding protein [unclassified Rhodococcus (in: high G+C Gram-positive bacteria)]OZC63543.1 TIGR03084 family protein [Rhodococcus sp. 06-469-3-2]OZD40708.1 TIGR03084 family protein [Rhodococcus sp. 06-1477-1A]OZE67184.1 TIGR03084 family protein [Rhodococcus sp. 15-725-2-2b]
MPVDMQTLLADLADETSCFRDLIVDLDEKGWRTATPAAGWSIADQVSHLAYFDAAAVRALTDPSGFLEEKDRFDRANGIDPDRIAQRYRDRSGESLLAWFDDARAQLLEAFSGRTASDRLNWYGPSMSVASSATARLMETWAHGVDVADAQGMTVSSSTRLHHIAHLGVGTRSFSFALHGRSDPIAPVRVELIAPDACRWAWGPPQAPDLVSGPALDFCLAVTQRRHLDDLALTVEGETARAWMAIAQAFAGAAGPGRTPHCRSGRAPTDTGPATPS